MFSRLQKEPSHCGNEQLTAFKRAELGPFLPLSFVPFESSGIGFSPLSIFRCAEMFYINHRAQPRDVTPSSPPSTAPAETGNVLCLITWIWCTTVIFADYDFFYYYYYSSLPFFFFFSLKEIQQRDGEGVLSPVPYPQAPLPSLIKNDSEESERRGLIFTWERQRGASSKTFWRRISALLSRCNLSRLHLYIKYLYRFNFLFFAGVYSIYKYVEYRSILNI